MAHAADATAVGPGETNDGDDAVKQAAPAAAKSLLARRKLIGLAAPVILGVAGAGLWYTGMLKRFTGGATNKNTKADATRLFAMPELIANLNGGANVERYVKVDIRLVVTGKAALAIVKSHEPELQDMFLSYLRDMHPEELQRPTGTWRLREALLERAAVVVGPGRVTNVLFTNLLIQ